MAHLNERIITTMDVAYSLVQQGVIKFSEYMHVRLEKTELDRYNKLQSFIEEK